MSENVNAPMGVSRLIGASFKLACQSYGQTIVLALLASLAIVITSLMWQIPATTTGGAVTVGVISIVVTIVAAVMGIASYAAMVRKINIVQHQLGAETCTETFKVGLRHFWPLLAAMILGYLSIALGFAIFVLPGIFLSVALYVYFPVVMLEDKNPLEAYAESIRLSWGSWWRTAIVLLFVMICFGIGYEVISLLLVDLPVLFLAHHPHIVAVILPSLTKIIALTLFYPWFTAMALVLLSDYKLRKRNLS